MRLAFTKIDVLQFLICTDDRVWGSKSRLHIELKKLYAVGDLGGATLAFQAKYGPQHGV